MLHKWPNSFHLTCSVNTASRVLRNVMKQRALVTHHKPNYMESKRNKDFFLTVLSATATKRDAKAYIEKYQNAPTQHSHTYFQMPKNQSKETSKILPRAPIRAALVLIRDTIDISDKTLIRIGNTLGQLQRLGLQPVIILQTDQNGKRDIQTRRQVDRVVELLEKQDISARPVYEGLFRVSESLDVQAKDSRTVVVEQPETLILPILRAQIPVIGSTAFGPSNMKTLVSSEEAMQAICSAFGKECETHSIASAFVVDKLIVLDEVGGIQSHQRRQGSHVFINLEQEYEELKEDFKARSGSSAYRKHLHNLEACNQCLGFLNESSSAVVTTHNIAGSMNGEAHPLIHNLLTDKPMFSPSLPVMGSRTPSTLTTVLRKGLGVRSYFDFKLLSSPIDLPKLVSLINNSFDRELDIQAYLDRVEGKIAAVIVAGDYSGAAIITYEMGHSTRAVPYLDKFAVRREKQGAGGVADVLFNEMVKVFPEELVWRSRTSNPVNKWYFERAQGSLSLPGSEWKLFWTTDNIQNTERFKDYCHVGVSIKPTWKKSTKT